jgi:hypothetical protein
VVVEPGLIETEFGDVVAEGLLKVSRSCAYAKLTQATAKATKDAYARACGTDSTVIARVASNALNAKAATQPQRNPSNPSSIWWKMIGTDYRA